MVKLEERTFYSKFNIRNLKIFDILLQEKECLINSFLLNNIDEFIAEPRIVCIILFHIFLTFSLWMVRSLALLLRGIGFQFPITSILFLCVALLIVSLAAAYFLRKTEDNENSSSIFRYIYLSMYCCVYMPIIFFFYYLMTSIGFIALFMFFFLQGYQLKVNFANERGRGQQKRMFLHQLALLGTTCGYVAAVSIFLH